jgi:4-hydroxy-2-oxoheptanedioate aldolase
LIDCEHGNISDNDMYLAIGAITSAGSSPIVRVAAGEPWLLKRALDAGAHGIMIPMCETKVCNLTSLENCSVPFAIPFITIMQEQAAAIVAAMKYPSKRWPQGIRGAGAMFAPANFNQDSRQYLETANNNVLVIVQIETRKALDNVDEIAATDGIGKLNYPRSFNIYFGHMHADYMR